MDKLELSDKKFQTTITIFVIFIILMTVFIGAIDGSDKDLMELDELDNEESFTRSKLQDTTLLSEDKEGLFLDTVDDSEDVGKHTSIVVEEVEEKKLVFISYYSDSSEALKIAQNDVNDPEKDWERWTIDRGGDVGGYSSLELDGDMKAHIAYYDATYTRLKYVLWCGEYNRVESIEIIDDKGEVGKYVSLELDEDHDPRVSYHDSSRGSLKYAERKDGIWRTSTVDDNGENLGRHTSLALDSDSQPHISFYDWEGRDLKYAERVVEDETIDWEIQTIEEAGGLIGKYTSLELDEDDNAHISCYEWTDGYKRLKYVTDSIGGEWTSEKVSESDPSGTYTSLELYGTSQPLISYHEWGEENLILAVKDEDGWTNIEIDIGGRVGTHTSLDYIGQAETHMSYYDQGKGELKHARYFFKNRTPLAPQSFSTRSEYGDIILEWESPIYDGIKAKGDHILGYHIYRSEGDEFEKIDNVTGFSYKDEIEREDETKVFDYRIAAVNRIGVGDNSSVIQTKGRYFSYERSLKKANEYSLLKDGLLPIKDEKEGPYEIRWDLDYDPNEGPKWEDEAFKEGMYKSYDEVGLKSILFEYENGRGDKRRCLQSAWVLGDFELTSTYERSGSEERFFHLLEDKKSFEYLSGEDGLENTYILETQEDLPYEYIEFEFLGENETVENSVLEQDKDTWRNSFRVSDSEENSDVKVIPYLYNEHIDEVENPLGFPHHIELKNEKEVEIIDTPSWFPFLLDAFFGENLEINNVKEDGDYIGWEVDFEIPEVDDEDDLKEMLENIDISGTPELDILDDLERYFGGDYGFEMELFPDREICFDNDLNFETTLIQFYTDIDEDDMGIDSFDGELGNSFDYAADPEMEVSAGISIDLLVKKEGISVSGILELEVGAGIQIDIPLKSIGFAEVGLTAEIGGEIGVEYEVGALDYEDKTGLSLDPGDGEIPIEFILSFGGGPYGEVAAGLARIEGKLILEVIVGLELPSKDTGIDHAGRFEVEVSAGWGLWSRTRKWELYSTAEDSTSIIRMGTNSTVRDDMLSTDRLATRDYGLNDDTSLLNLDGFKERKNVGPRVDPQIESLGKDSAIAVWSELSKDIDGNVKSDLYMQEFSEGVWKNGVQKISTEGDMAYEPKLLSLEDKIALIYLEIEEKPDEFDTVEELEEYYTDDVLKGKSWCPENGWSDLGLNHSIQEKAITSFDVDVDDHGDIHIVYRSGYPSLDIFEAPSSLQGEITVLKQDGEDWAEMNGLDIPDEPKYLPQSSRPSIEFVDGEGAVIYTRTFDDDEGEYDESCFNQTFLVPLDGEDSVTVLETKNTISHQLLSEENGDMVVSWVDNHTEIRRKVVDRSWDVPDHHTTIHSNETVTGLDHHVNESSSYYVFQRGVNAAPTLIESTEDGWDKKRSIFGENNFAANQLDTDFDLEYPTMVMVEKKETIEDWHCAHHRFDGSLSEGMVKDRSDETNTGELKGDWTRKKHNSQKSHGRYGYYVNFEGEKAKMVVDHCSSLNVTEDTEDFTVTALLNGDEYDPESYLMRKEDSWGVVLNSGEVEIELWNEDEKHTFSTGIEFPSGWTFFALRYEEDWLNLTLKSYDDPGSLDENTMTLSLNDFGSLSSSIKPLKLAEGSGTLSLDDFRLVKRYLPDVSIEKINRTSYPNFDLEYSVSSNKIPPYVNFTYSERPVVGSPIEFTAQSQRSDLNYSWSFEDGVQKSGGSIEYVFTKTGYHTVSLEAKDKETGAKTRYEKTLHVIDVNPPRFDVVPEIIERYEENNSVKVGWDEAEGESEPFEYRIHHETGKEIEWDQNHWRVSTRETSIVIEDLDPNKKHHILVSVVNDVGLTNTSPKCLTFEIEDSLPPRFDGLNSTYVDHTEMIVGLGWHEAEDASESISYNIYHSKTEDMNFEEPVETSDETEKLITVSEIGEHYFAVRAEDTEGNEDDNEKIEIVVVKDIEPPDIQITSPSGEKTVDSTVTLEWDAYDNNSGISTYWVKRDDENWIQVQKESYTFHDLPEGERRLTVKAVDYYDNSADDSIDLFVVDEITPEINFDSPFPLPGSKNVSMDIELKIDVLHEDELDLNVSFYTADINKKIGTDEGVSSGEAASVTWNDLEYNTTYEWYVKADDDEYIEISEVWNFTTSSTSKEEHTLKINEPVGGRVEVDREEITDWPYEEFYKNNTQVELKAVPEKGWFFEGWGGTEKNGEIIVVEMNTDKEITAHFEKDALEKYELKIDIEGEGTTDPSKGIHTYEHGENVTVKATAAEDWYFKKWTGSVESIDEEITIHMDDQKEIVAVFSNEELENFGLTIQIEGEGSVEIDPDRDYYEDGDEVILSTESSEDWNFSHWLGDIIDEQREEREITLTMDEDKSIIAHFEKVNPEIEYELIIDVEGEGFTVPEQGTYNYASGEKIYVRAEPKENGNFSHWEGDVSAEKKEDMEITITMESDMEITAHFEEGSEEKGEDDDSDGLSSHIFSVQIVLGIIFFGLIAAVFVAYRKSDVEIFQK